MLIFYIFKEQKKKNKNTSSTHIIKLLSTALSYSYYMYVQIKCSGIKIICNIY